MMLATDLADPERILAGGPVGDLAQWADLIAGLHVLGHNVTLTPNFYDAARE